MRSMAAVLAGVVVLGAAYARAVEEPVQAPLTLQEAVATALRNHPTIRMGQATVEAAQQRVRQQIAGYLPKGAYTYTYSRQARPLTSAVGGVNIGGQQTRTVTQLFNFNSTNFRVDQLLFDFGRTFHSIQSAVAATEASTADLETIRQEIIFNTKQAYYSVLSAQRLLGVAEETVQQNQKHLEEAQARFEVGVAPRFDVTQAQVQVSTAELSRVEARNNVALGFATLRRAMGQDEPLQHATLIDQLEHHPVLVAEEAIVQDAYVRRPELESIRAQQRASAAQVSALQKQFLPSVAGTAQYNWTGREFPLQEGWMWGVTLTVPLFDSILTTSQLGEAHATLRNFQAQEDNLRQQVTLEVQQGLLNLRRAEESLRVNAQTLVQARENLDLAEGRYAAGVGNIIEVTDAQVSLTSAQANNVKALYDYKTALAELEKAVGASLD